MAWLICSECGGRAQLCSSAEAAEESAKNHSMMNGHQVRTSSGKTFPEPQEETPHAQP